MLEGGHAEEPVCDGRDLPRAAETMGVEVLVESVGSKTILLGDISSTECTLAPNITRLIAAPPDRSDSRWRPSTPE